MREQRDPPDVVVARCAERQYGVVTAEQLAQAGFDKSAVSRRCKLGRLHRIHRGVYAVGHSRLGNEGRWIAAVLACGEGAVLSHVSAAAFLGLVDPRPGPVDVTVPGRGGSPLLIAQELGMRMPWRLLRVVRRRGIDVTTPARTLADLRRTIDPATLRRSIRQAEVIGYAVGDLALDGTRSELERQFLALCRRHRLPPPEVNARVGRYVVDFLWRYEGLVVEVDGWRYHRGRTAFERDRERDLDLHRAGLTVLRVTARQLDRASLGVARAVAQGLLAGSSR